MNEDRFVLTGTNADDTEPPLDRYTLSKALANLILRFTSRKFLAAMLGIVILFYAMTHNYVDADTAIKGILGILATYAGIEGVPDIVERLRRD